MAAITPYLVALLAAAIGLWIWRLQQLTLRKLAVAEEATTAMWEAADALRSARSRGIFAGEGSTYQGRDSDDERSADSRRKYFIVRERLEASSDKFARLAAVRSPVRYHLGKAALDQGPLGGPLGGRHLDAIWVRVGSSARGPSEFDAHCVHSRRKRQTQRSDRCGRKRLGRDMPKGDAKRRRLLSHQLIARNAADSTTGTGVKR